MRIACFERHAAMQVALDAAQNLRLIHVIPEELFEDVIEDEDGGWASGDSDAEETYGPADSDYSDLHSLSDLLLTAFTCGNSGDAEPTASPTAGGPQAARPRPHVLPAHIRKVGVCLKTVDLPSSAPGPTGDAESRSQQRHYLVPDSVFEDEVEDGGDKDVAERIKDFGSSPSSYGAVAPAHSIGIVQASEQDSLADIRIVSSKTPLSCALMAKFKGVLSRALSRSRPRPFRLTRCNTY
jgi:hypothetical protein